MSAPTATAQTLTRAEYQGFVCIWTKDSVSFETTHSFGQVVRKEVPLQKIESAHVEKVKGWSSIVFGACLFVGAGRLATSLMLAAPDGQLLPDDGFIRKVMWMSFAVAAFGVSMPFLARGRLRICVSKKKGRKLCWKTPAKNAETQHVVAAFIEGARVAGVRLEGDAITTEDKTRRAVYAPRLAPHTPPFTRGWELSRTHALLRALGSSRPVRPPPRRAGLICETVPLGG